MSQHTQEYMFACIAGISKEFSLVGQSLESEKVLGSVQA